MVRRLSAQTLAVLQSLAADPGRWRYGYELGQEVALKAGSLYPILMRMHERGLLESSWETDPPAGRPPRHLYRLTAAGARQAAEHATENLAGSEPRKAPRSARPSIRTLRLGGAW
jgi:PadR family transcriptional regulator PadR